MRSRRLEAHARMRQVAELLLGAAIENEKHHNEKGEIHYEFSSKKGSVHFIDAKHLSDMETHYGEEHGEIKSFKVSENIFCNHCRYIYYHNKNPKSEEMMVKVRHYDYIDYEWEELFARLKVIDIIDELKYGMCPVLKTQDLKEGKSVMNKSICEFGKFKTKGVRMLFDLVGYSKEEMHNSWEPASVYFSIATRLLYDDDYQINIIGRGIINCLICHME